MKNIRVFLSENFQFLEVKFSIYLNRRPFIMVDQPYLMLYTAKASMTRTSMARLPWLIPTQFLVPRKFLR